MAKGFVRLGHLMSVFPLLHRGPARVHSIHQLSGKTNGIPAIVGWDHVSLVAVMNAYKSKERENKVMQNIAGTLSDEDIAALASYFGTIKAKEN